MLIGNNVANIFGIFAPRHITTAPTPYYKSAYNRIIVLCILLLFAALLY